MKSSRSKQAKPDTDTATATGPIASWMRFWFDPVDPVGLHVVRLLAGLLFLAWLLPFAGNLDSLFSLHGWFDLKAYAELARLQDNPFQPVSWSILYLCSTPTSLTIVYWLSLGVIALFTLGVWTRLTSVLTWVIVASFISNPALDYDADVLLNILAFYLMIGYVLLGQTERRQSWPARLLGSRTTWFLGRNDAEPRTSLGANLALRLLQVHLALVMLVNGLHKLQFGEWWAGVALWYPLHPPFETTIAQAQQHAFPEVYLSVLNVGAYAMLAWQIAFPVYAWSSRWRILLVGGAVIGWLGTAFLFHLPLLGPAFLVGCLSFVTAEEWRRLFTLLSRLPGLQRLADWLPSQDGDRSANEETVLVTSGQR